MDNSKGGQRKLLLKPYSKQPLPNSDKGGTPKTFE